MRIKLPKFSWLLLCLLLQGCVGAVFSGASAAYDHKSIQKKASDYYVIAKAKEALNSDPEIKAQNISVTSFNDILLLIGQVPNAELRNKAAALAQNVPYVLKVYNGITVGPPISAAQKAQDSWITTKIKTQLIANKDIDPSKIKVVTENSVVYLMGIVPKDQADIATDIARHTDGVNQVITIFYYITMPTIN